MGEASEGSEEQGVVTEDDAGVVECVAHRVDGGAEGLSCGWGAKAGRFVVRFRMLRAMYRSGEASQAKMVRMRE